MSLFVVILGLLFETKQPLSTNKKTKEFVFEKTRICCCCCLGLFSLKRVIFFKFGPKAYFMVI